MYDNPLSHLDRDVDSHLDTLFGLTPTGVLVVLLSVWTSNGIQLLKFSTNFTSRKLL